MHRLLLWLFATIFFTACHGQEAPKEEAAASEPRPLLVYEKFEQLAPLFEHDNDTTYLINFWATWCKPCVEELPYFEEITRKYRGQPLRVVLVSLDFPRDVETKLPKFLEANQIESEVQVLLDGNYNDWIDRVDTNWGGAIPVTLIYRGAERQFVNGSFANTAELDELVQAFINR